VSKRISDTATDTATDTDTDTDSDSDSDSDSGSDAESESESDSDADARHPRRRTVETIRRHDRSLGDQLRRSLTSIGLNLGEGNASRDGHRRARFDDALGSTQESRVALRIAAAWQYVDGETVRGFDAELDSIAARIYRLGRQ
jgi:four helix bundle protein